MYEFARQYFIGFLVTVFLFWTIIGAIIGVIMMISAVFNLLKALDDAYFMKCERDKRIVELLEKCAEE